MVHGTLSLLIDRLQAEPHGSFSQSEFIGISTDTRKLAPGSIFVALEGEQMDGHTFARQAIDQGAIAVIAHKPISVPHLRVSDTLVAYQQVGQWWRSQFPIPVIAITGSAGKTSTKDMLAAALSRYGATLKSQANFNNDIGVPLTLLQIQPDHQFVVLEMAMRGPGEITRLAQTAQPTHALITNVGSAHIGRLGSHAAIAQAKCELLQIGSLQAAILNGEDDRLLTTAAQVWQGTPITYGLATGRIQGHWDPTSQSVQIGDLVLPVPLPGRHHALNWMGVIATIQSLKLPLDPLQSPLELPADRSGRNHHRILPRDIEILDETYNAAPEAMIAALHLLSQTPGIRRWAILGPMRELGDFAPDLYAQVGTAAAPLPIDQILLFDPDQEMTPLLDAVIAGRSGDPSHYIRSFRSKADLIEGLTTHLQAGDRFLFKAARSIELETVMQALITAWESQ